MMLLSSLVIFFLQTFVAQSEHIENATLKPINPFSAIEDARKIKQEMEKDYPDINRDLIVFIWFHRTYDQRRQIKEFYDGNFCSLVHRCPLLDGFQDISVDAMMKLYELSLISLEGILAAVVYESINGKWKEVGGIEEVLCANDKQTKDRIAKYYQSTYKNTVESHLKTFREEDQDYQHIMQQYCWKGLCQEKKIKPEDVDKEVQALRAINPDENKEEFKNKLKDLLGQNCEPDMKMILEKYRQNGNSIEDAIDQAFEVKRQRRAYNRLVRYIENTCQFYADELHEAFHGHGTDIDKINRIMLTRCERDLGCILKKYEEICGETFNDRLKSDISEVRYLKCIEYLCGKA